MHGNSVFVNLRRRALGGGFGPFLALLPLLLAVASRRTRQSWNPNRTSGHPNVEFLNRLLDTLIVRTFLWCPEVGLEFFIFEVSRGPIGYNFDVFVLTILSVQRSV